MKKDISIIIPIISVIIAILSLILTLYIGMSDIEYKKDIMNLQKITQEMQKDNNLFEENYKKIQLIQENVFYAAKECEEINKKELEKNLQLISEAKKQLINEDFDKVTQLLNQINYQDMCSEAYYSIGKYIEVWIIIFIWIVLIIGIIRQIIIKK